MKTENVTLTNMCMIYDGDRVLVQNRTKSDWPGVTFPGGHVEKGEPFTDSVIREVFEETGLIVSSPRLCGIKDWINSDGSRYIVLCYKTDIFTGSLCASNEGDVYWVSLDELSNLCLAQDMAALLRVFLDDKISEFFYYCENGGWNYVLK